MNTLFIVRFKSPFWARRRFSTLDFTVQPYSSSVFIKSLSSISTRTATGHTGNRWFFYYDEFLTICQEFQYVHISSPRILDASGIVVYYADYRNSLLISALMRVNSSPEVNVG